MSTRLIRRLPGLTWVMASMLLASPGALRAGDGPHDAPGLASPGGAAAKATDPQGGAVILRRQKIRDTVTNMDAISILVPEGWKMDGKTLWVGRGAGLVLSYVTVADPNTQAAVTSYPDLTFVDGKKEVNERMWPGQQQYWEKRCAEGNLDVLGCEFRQMATSPMDFFKRFAIPRFRPDVDGAADKKVLWAKDLPPEYLKKAAASSGNSNAQAAASRIRIQYTSGNTLMDEEFICTVLHLQIGQAPLAYTLWGSNLYSFRAPAGKLDAMLPTMLAIHDSQSEELPFFNRKMQIIQMLIDASQKELDALNADAQARMRAMHDYFIRTIEETSEKNRANFANQQAAKDQAHQQFMNYINGVQAFSNPGGGILTLPANYNFYYGDGNGGVAFSNDPTYQPPVGYQRLQKSPY